MTLNTAFAPTRAAALTRITPIRPADYARSRNAIGDAATRLSPYNTHRLVMPMQAYPGEHDAVIDVELWDAV